MNRTRLLYALWIAAIAALFLLHFPHIRADFPNHSPWMDESKYTDEGWYANAALRHFVSGHWYLRGDFNPAVALPVWPLVLAGVFRWTGVSLAAARITVVAILGVNLLLIAAIVRARAPLWVALTAVSILVTNPFLYAFSRLALLEPLAIFFLLVSWLLALRLRPGSPRGQTGLLAAIGVALCLLVLTKTTGLFLVPSTVFVVAWAYEFRWGRLPSALATVSGAAVVPWCAWYFVLVRPHYRTDFHYLFEANSWPQPRGVAGHLMAWWWALHGVLWISPLLCGLACAVAAALWIPAARARNAEEIAAERQVGGAFWRHPIVAASLLAIAGTVVFAGASNHPQPRYYEAAIYPLACFLALGVGALARGTGNLAVRLLRPLALAAIAGACLGGTLRIVSYVRFPEYTWLEAAQGVARIIRGTPGTNHLLLSISGDEIQLMTGTPSICDDFGTWDLPDRIHAYQPSWFATWNEVDPGTLDDIRTEDSLEPVAYFRALDDPDRDVLILYRMIPGGSHPAKPTGKRRSRRNRRPHSRPPHLPRRFGSAPGSTPAAGAGNPGTAI